MNLNITDYTKQEIIEIYKRNVNTIYRLAYLYLKNPADAEDATQTIFLKIMKLSPHFSCIAHEKAWCITVTKNYCKDLLKSFWRTHRVEITNLPDIPDESSQQDDVLLELLLTLPAKYKEVLYLYYYEEYSISEISSMLKQKESTLQTRLATGRIKLKELYERSIVNE